MRLLWARFLRTVHCAFRLHRPATMWADGKTLFLVCSDCHKVFYLDKKTWNEKFQDRDIFEIWVNG